jgi:quinol monooxygenase YgiN
MIVIKITMNAIPGKQLEMTQTLLSMIEPTEKEAGCISYGVFCDTKDKNRFCLLGEWKTREALNQHIASHQFSVLLGTKALLCEPLDIQIFTVSRSEGMDAVHSIRDLKKSNKSPADGQRSLIK